MALSKIKTGSLTDSSVTTGKILNNTILDADISSSTTISASKLAVTVTYPTISALTPSVIENTATAVVITGTNFVSVPYVDAISSTGAIVVADAVSYTSATSITATFTLPIDGTYFIRVENPDGLAAKTTTADLTVSDAPAWVTASGSLGTFDGNVAISTQTLTCTDATSFAITSGAIATGLTFTTGVGSCTITGTQTQYSAAATNNFTVTATDAESQTSNRAFSMTWSFGLNGSGGFN